MRKRDGEEAVLERSDARKNSDGHYSVFTVPRDKVLTAFLLVLVLAALVTHFVAIGLGKRHALLTGVSLKVRIAMAGATLFTGALISFLL